MYVIAGVSGNTGSVVAEALLRDLRERVSRDPRDLAQGKKVRVIVRDAKKGESWKARGAEVAIASVDDEAALTKALEGATGVYLLSPPDVTAQDLLADKRATVEAMANAVEKSEVAHVVLLSSSGAQHEKGTGIIRTLQYAEERLAKTSAKTTFIRAAYFLENWGGVLGAAAQGKLPTFLPPDLVVPMVSTRDIGLVAAKALLAGPPAAKTDIIELAGPRDYTSRDLAGILAKVYGKPVDVEAAPLDAVIPTFSSFGFSANVAGLFRDMYEGIANGTVAFEGKGARLVRGTVDAEAAFRSLGAGTPSSI